MVTKSYYEDDFLPGGVGDFDLTRPQSDDDYDYEYD